MTTLTLIQSMPVLGKNEAAAWVCTWCSARHEACSLLKCDIVGVSVFHMRLPRHPWQGPGQASYLASTIWETQWQKPLNGHSLMPALALYLQGM